MSNRSTCRTLIRRLCLAQAIAMACTSSIWSAENTTAAASEMIDITLQLANGMKNTYDQPLIVLWLEDKSNHFVRTLYRFGINHNQIKDGVKGPGHYRDLPVSFPLSSKAEKALDLDAVTGATVIWGTKGHIRLPTQWRGINLLSGNFIMRVEAAKDSAKQYPPFSIPLAKTAIGKTFPEKGYVTSLVIAKAPADAEAITEPIMIPDPDGARVPLAAGEVETAKATGTVVAITPAPAANRLPSVTLKLDGSGDTVAYWPRKGKPETDEITKLILACKVGEHKQISYTEDRGGRLLTLEDAPKGH